MAGYLEFNSLTSVDLSNMKTNFYYLNVKVVIVTLCLFVTVDTLGQIGKNKRRTTAIDTLDGDSVQIDSTKTTLIKLPERTEEGEFVLNMDSAITSLYIDAAEKEVVLKGYRIQIYFGDLESARAVRAKCRKQLDHDRIYLESITPNYSVAIGDYRDRWEAEIALSNLKIKYRDALIVPAEIKMPDLK
ncbi:MAG: hypothetical protein CL847_00015 [Crocinitomicaceae bacterium]|nr:hypothetical protein [Crocinitomicaceae bacterium]|tara:strand:+ start:4520 stop:5083 length:564 start_codon:yes stop_codon:yes gene_type:complete